MSRVNVIKYIRFRPAAEPAAEPVAEAVAVAEPEPTYTSSTEETGAYISCYPYESAEVGDLTFGAGEYITVIKKDGDWWTGTIGDRTGIFPSNYVQEASAIEAINVDPTTDNYYSTQQSTQNYSDDVQNQEEADTEVSEINTQPKSESVQDSFTRPMSTSSTTSVNQTYFVVIVFNFIKSSFFFSIELSW